MKLSIRLSKGSSKSIWYIVVTDRKRVGLRVKWLDKLGYVNLNRYNNFRTIFIDKGKFEKWIKYGAEPSKKLKNLL